MLGKGESSLVAYGEATGVGAGLLPGVPAGDF